MKEVLKFYMSLVLCALFAFFAEASSTIEAPQNPEKFISSHLHKSHPRLVLTDERLSELKKLAVADADLQKIVKDVIAKADKNVKEGVIPKYYKRDGVRLLRVSRTVMGEMYLLGFAWRWTGGRKYADHAIKILQAVCEFKNWNPKHFLDTAEMCHAVAIGYDWFYSVLTPEQRKMIKDSIVRKGLKARGVDFYCKKTNNWNVVCNGGITIGALAVADEEPGLAAKSVSRMIKNVPVCLKQFAPDGVWVEGMGYWDYTARYMAFLLSSLDSALGTDFNLSKLSGIKNSPLFVINAVGPTGRFLTYADAGGKRWYAQFPVFFWFAGKFDKPVYAGDEMGYVMKYTANPLHAVWFPDSHSGDIERKKDLMFNGRVPIMFSRSSLNDKNALWFGVKGGDNQVPHGHLDLGNFELDALGVRWATDLGGDNYNIPGYWQKRRGGKRWNYFRTNSHGHNVPLVDGKGQDPESVAPITKFISQKDYAFGIIDLTQVYAWHGVKSAKRGIQMLPGRREVLVQDEFVLDHDGTVTFGLTTEADAEVVKNGVLLSIKGKKCLLEVLSPAKYKVEIKNAPQGDKPHKSNKGIRRVEITANTVIDKLLTFAVVFRPEWSNEKGHEEIKINSLKEWK